MPKTYIRSTETHAITSPGADLSLSRFGSVPTGYLRGEAKRTHEHRVRTMRASCPVDERTQREYRNLRREGYAPSEAWQVIQETRCVLRPSTFGSHPVCARCASDGSCECYVCTHDDQDDDQDGDA